MAGALRNTNLRLRGVSPLRPLFGGRWALERRFDVNHAGDLRANAYTVKVFSGFDTVDGAPGPTGFSKEVQAHEAYPDLRLVDEELIEVGGEPGGRAPVPVLVQRFETLTTTWAKEIEDVDDTTESGLKRRTRVLVARAGTALPAGLSVGVTTDDGLVLAGVRDEGDDRRGKVTLVWAEPGVMSQDEDKVGSQLAITIEAFAETPATPAGGYVLARENESNVEGIPTRRFTFLKPSILSVSTPKIGGQQQVRVQAFNLDEAAVVLAVSEVTENHKTIDVSASDVEGIPTRSFTFEVDSFDTRQRTDNGLLVLSRTELSATAHADGNVGTTTITDGALTLYLAGEEIDNGNAIKRRITRWAQSGILSVSDRNLSEGVKEVTTVFLAVEGSTVGPVVRKSEESISGLRTISVTTLQDKEGNSIVDGGENLVHRYQRQVDFTYPGTVGLRQDIITSSVGVDPNILNFEIAPPVQAKVNGTISVIFQTSGNIVSGDETYNDGSGSADSFWNPKDWARTYVSGIGWNYMPFSVSQGLRGYRVNNDVSGIEKLTPEGSNIFVSNGVTIITAAGTSYLNTSNSSTPGSIFARLEGVADNKGLLFTVDGKRIFASTPFIMQASGGPVNPVGTRFVLDIDIRPAFEDIDGNVYYKKTIVTATP